MMSTGDSQPAGRHGTSTAFEAREYRRPRESAVEFVVNEIKRALVAGELEPGARLPTELELAERLSVSRGPVREAIKVLEALGAVRIVRGDGTYVAQSPRDALVNPLVFSLALSQPSRRELVEFRETIELGIERLIRANADEADLDALEEANAALARAVGSGADAATLTRLDIDFHRALGRATHNELIGRTYALVMDYFAPMIRSTQRSDANGANAVGLHDELIASLRARDGERCARAIRRWIEEWASRF